jgi:hypothetical protein
MSDNAANTYLAVQDLRPQLPVLVGPEKWPSVAAKLDHLDTAWAAAGAENERRRIALQYRDALAPWSAAYERIRAPLDGVSAYSDALRRLALRAELAGNLQAAAALRDEAENRRRIIIERGVGRGAYSIKLGNIRIRFWKLPALAAAVLATVVAVVDPAANSLTIAAAVLAAIGGLEALVKEIPVDDASVFLGLVEAGGESRQAHLGDIRAAANAARAQTPGYLQPLDEAQVKAAITNLLALGSIARVEGQADLWQAVEDHGRL